MCAQENVSLRTIGPIGVSLYSFMPDDGDERAITAIMVYKGKAGRSFNFFRHKDVINQPRVAKMQAKDKHS